MAAGQKLLELFQNKIHSVNHLQQRSMDQSVALGPSRSKDRSPFSVQLMYMSKCACYNASPSLA